MSLINPFHIKPCFFLDSNHDLNIYGAIVLLLLL